MKYTDSAVENIKRDIHHMRACGLHDEADKWVGILESQGEYVLGLERSEGMDKCPHCGSDDHYEYRVKATQVYVGMFGAGPGSEECVETEHESSEFPKMVTCCNCQRRFKVPEKYYTSHWVKIGDEK